MQEKEIIQRLALERCRLSVSHICALFFLAGADGDASKVVANMNDAPRSSKGTEQYYQGLFESLNRDLSIIEDILSTQSSI